MMEVVWPLDNRDYLTVCDNHPTPYVSGCAILAETGEADDAPEHPPFNPPRLADYEIIATSPLLMKWMTLRELAEEMECSDREVASLAKHLAEAVKHGLLERQQVPRTWRGLNKVMRWCYRRMLK